MNVTPEEAREALNAIQQTTIKTRRALTGSYFLIIWGIVWLFGFLANQFLRPDLLAWVWAPLVTLAWISSAILGIYQGRQMRTTIGPRIGFFYSALIAYSVLWFIILQPISANRNILFLITIILFGGLIAGILIRSISTVIGCLSLTLLALLGYYLLPAYFSLWVALTCGGSMIGIGVYLRFGWR